MCLKTAFKKSVNCYNMRRLFTYLFLIITVLTVSSCGLFEKNIKLSIDDEVYDSSEQTIIITTNDLQIVECYVNEYVYDNSSLEWVRTNHLGIYERDSLVEKEWYSITLQPKGYEIEVKLKENDTDSDRRLTIRAVGFPGNGSDTVTITQKAKE